MSTSVVKQRRGTVRASITRLSTKLKELEEKSDHISLDLAKGMKQKLESLDAEFRKYHYGLIDLIDEGDEETLLKEQEVLDNHDDEVATLATRIERFIISRSSSDDSNLRRINSRKLSRLEKSVSSILATIDSSSTPVDVCLLRQHEEQLRDLKVELRCISNSIVAMDLDDTDELSVLQAKLERERCLIVD